MLSTMPQAIMYITLVSSMFELKVIIYISYIFLIGSTGNQGSHLVFDSITVVRWILNVRVTVYERE